MGFPPLSNEAVHCTCMIDWVEDCLENASGAVGTIVAVMEVDTDEYGDETTELVEQTWNW